MKEVIDQYKDVIIQIATPYGTGSGFYVNEYDVIVTNKHVVQGTDEVVVNGHKFDKSVTSVLFSDPVNDLAFLQSPEGADMPGVELARDEEISAGEQILAIGHPFGLKYSATQGIVSKADRNFNGVNYIQIDAAINPGNSGGPLLNNNGEIVGVNTFIIQEGDNLGFAVPVKNLRISLEDYRGVAGERAMRCSSCSVILTEDKLDGEYCQNCGSKVNMEDFKPKPYEPTGVSKTMEDIITKLGKDARICRVGPNAWDVEEGSATIKIGYNTNTRFIIGDAHLCRLPKEDIGPLYEYLLHENYTLEGVVFSVANQDIVLSLLVYEDDLTIETGMRLFKDLIKKADDYDNILIEQYGARWITREE